MRPPGGDSAKSESLGRDSRGSDERRARRRQGRSLGRAAWSAHSEALMDEEIHTKTTASWGGFVDKIRVCISVKSSFRPNVEGSPGLRLAPGWCSEARPVTSAHAGHTMGLGLVVLPQHWPAGPQGSVLGGQGQGLAPDVLPWHRNWSGPVAGQGRSPTRGWAGCPTLGAQGLCALVCPERRARPRPDKTMPPYNKVPRNSRHVDRSYLNRENAT